MLAEADAHGSCPSKYMESRLTSLIHNQEKADSGEIMENLKTKIARQRERGEREKAGELLPTVTPHSQERTLLRSRRWAAGSED